MVFSTKRGKLLKESKSKIQINIDNFPLDNVTEYKYLGILLDEHLNYSSHISMIKQKISFRLYTLKKIRWMINKNDSLNIYKSMIMPYIDIGDT